MNPGDVVLLTHPIHTALVNIPPGTPGIVQWAYPNMARVQFAGFVCQSNVPLDWLAPARITVDDGIEI